ncbi:MAG: polymer-forming cytoskeletal protein [Candidatus Aminicenantes bacterium]|nr:polymer-forming cytoskeletal protein [Candidatus Aminicenantes bacterium]NIM80402.1 polymer-forming cytoskeletal protein [Candidatus Aminicenantes bacterium]NIN19789.1 polymer-forming cytoskeletal protein [Candidatus Aminicenantes bacterium]NIN43671.1 polymer-forming cytoskeletal protein [Candidatus Aminicenantes bacterium]NIN86416.1 polymer-forming cytoskeletal protein [Candidatus Aminicenantes bacterium]
MVFRSTKKDDKKRDDAYVISTAVEVEEDVHVPMSYIGESMKIKADITSDENVTIEGKVTGNIDISKTLTIGKKGSVKADIKAAIVRIIGEAKGNIVASEKVEILAQGRYTGNIQSQKLVVEEGAILNGNINQKKVKEKK